MMTSSLTQSATATLRSLASYSTTTLGSQATTINSGNKNTGNDVIPPCIILSTKSFQKVVTSVASKVSFKLSNFKDLICLKIS